jgi:hypothetical protein
MRSPNIQAPCQQWSKLWAARLGGRPAGCRRAPLSRKSQPACKPGSGWHAGNARTRDGHSSRTPVARRLQQPTRTASLDIDRGILPLARKNASRRPYSVLLPVGFAVPPALPLARCALTAPFHPYRGWYAMRRGGLFSVALSLGSRPPDVIRHRLSTEPGLSSPAFPLLYPPPHAEEGRVGARQRPSGRLTSQGWGR